MNWERDGTILGRRATHVLRISKSAPRMLREAHTRDTTDLLPLTSHPASWHFVANCSWLHPRAIRVFRTLLTTTFCEADIAPISDLEPSGLSY